ncbi:hypothetical protein BJ508DRAFT_336444 [Ascobolus immersus RN42]|uniref:Uncharacterized protein n=1 Tax=Ascobolus immersus RN42 TaxID=1160509 RepID=A0A3N4H8F9_ASCIM|nr:hypothetical protein BJ508DRAFT_336444 [Ascobolus immersus RN42]
MASNANKNPPKGTQPTKTAPAATSATSGKKNKPKCHYCSRSGHEEKHCWYLKRLDNHQSNPLSSGIQAPVTPAPLSVRPAPPFSVMRLRSTASRRGRPNILPVAKPLEAQKDHKEQKEGVEQEAENPKKKLKLSSKDSTIPPEPTVEDEKTPSATTTGLASQPPSIPSVAPTAGPKPAQKPVVS